MNLPINSTPVMNVPINSTPVMNVPINSSDPQTQYQISNNQPVYNHQSYPPPPPSPLYPMTSYSPYGNMINPPTSTFIPNGTYFSGIEPTPMAEHYEELDKSLVKSDIAEKGRPTTPITSNDVSTSTTSSKKRSKNILSSSNK